MEIEKVINPGRGRYGEVYCKISFKTKEDKEVLSITGVEGPTPNGGCHGNCGQIVDDLEFVRRCSPGWNQKTLRRFQEIWKRWHLNDMRASCEHQRETFDTQKRISLTRYTWSKKFHSWRTRAEYGILTQEDYALFQKIAPLVLANTTAVDPPKYETPAIKELLAGDWVCAEKIEKKAAGWVSHTSHPEGLLSKPCEVCGYKYGSSWLYEAVPEDVLEFLRGLPETTKSPVWI